MAVPACRRVWFGTGKSCPWCDVSSSWTFVPGKGVAVPRGTTLEGTDLLLERR